MSDKKLKLKSKKQGQLEFLKLENGVSWDKKEYVLTLTGNSAIEETVGVFKRANHPTFISVNGKIIAGVSPCATIKGISIDGLCKVLVGF